MTNLDADRLQITCVELYVIVHFPNGLPLGFLRTTALAPPALHALSNPPSFQNNNNNNKQFDKRKATD
jgi:hypothetical protein